MTASGIGAGIDFIYFFHTCKNINHQINTHIAARFALPIWLNDSAIFARTFSCFVSHDSQRILLNSLRNSVLFKEQTRSILKIQKK